MPTVPLEPVDSVAITTLVDNVCDLSLQNQGPAKRPGLGDPSVPRLPAAFLEGGSALDAPLAAQFPDAFIQNSIGTRFEL